ncbi:hypothetical protein [Silvimonas amylolytica]|nr:hypothetical protein [Silvimonas amylolytica]
MTEPIHAEQMKKGGTGPLGFWLVFVASAAFSGLLAFNAVAGLISTSGRSAQPIAHPGDGHGLRPRPGHVLAGQVSQSPR